MGPLKKSRLVGLNTTASPFRRGRTKAHIGACTVAYSFGTKASIISSRKKKSPINQKRKERKIRRENACSSTLENRSAGQQVEPRASRKGSEEVPPGQGGASTQEAVLGKQRKQAGSREHRPFEESSESTLYCSGTANVSAASTSRSGDPSRRRTPGLSRKLGTVARHRRK